MIDITSVTDGLDLGILDAQTPRAANILSVQLGALQYAQDLGIDLVFFLSDELKFQNESFKAYLIEVLAKQGISVASVGDTVENLFSRYTFNIEADDNSTALIAR